MTLLTISPFIQCDVLIVEKSVMPGGRFRSELPMSVRSLCLAILSFGDATGYEIRKESTEGRFSYFDDASFGSIYPALARLEAEGLVTVREEPQAGKPARKVYSITEAGRKVFIDSCASPRRQIPSSRPSC